MMLLGQSKLEAQRPIDLSPPNDRWPFVADYGGSKMGRVARGIERIIRYAYSRLQFDRSCYMDVKLGRITKTDERKLNSFQGQCLRWILRIRRQQRMTNKIVDCSQTLYFLFKVRRAPVIKNKNCLGFIDRQLKGINARRCFRKERKEK